MSLGFLVLAFVAVVNPARVRLGLPDDLRSGHERVRLVLLGALVALAAGAALLAPAEEILAAIEVSPESFRLATGLVLAVEGAWTLVRPAQPPSGVALAGRRAALVPVAFPLLLTPGLVALSLGAGADAPTAEALGALVVALALAVAAAALARGPRPDVLIAATARLLAAAEIVAAVVIAVDGVRDV